MASNSRSFIRGSWRTLSFRRYNPATALQIHWEVTVHETYIVLQNKRTLLLGYLDLVLPACPSINHLVKNKFPGFECDAISPGSSGLQKAFLAYGGAKNMVDIRPRLIDNCSQDMLFEVMEPQIAHIPPKAFKVFIVPLVFVRLGGLYLQITRDCANVTLTKACQVEGTNLASPEPQMFITGQAMMLKNCADPSLITQKAKAFKHKKACRVHTAEGIVSPVKCVAKGADYVRVGLAKPASAHFIEPIRVGLTLTKRALVAFKRSPYTQQPWTWNSLFVPIIYNGSTLTIPRACSASVLYDNIYTSFVPDLTALIMDAKQQSFSIPTTEWEPNKAAELVVRNTSEDSVVIRDGQVLGNAWFVLAPKLPLNRVLPSKLVARMAAAVQLPGNITLNAARLLPLCSFSQRSYTTP